MGIDNDAKLVVGWVLDTELVLKRMEEEKLESCCGPDCRCLCEHCLGGLAVPSGWALVSASPFFDSPAEYRTVALSAELGAERPHSDSASVSSVASVLADADLLAAGALFAATLGHETGSEPRVMALPHIW